METVGYPSETYAQERHCRKSRFDLRLRITRQARHSSGKTRAVRCSREAAKSHRVRHISIALASISDGGEPARRIHGFCVSILRAP